MLPAVQDEGGLEGLGSSPAKDDRKPTGLRHGAAARNPTRLQIFQSMLMPSVAFEAVAASQRNISLWLWNGRLFTIMTLKATDHTKTSKNIMAHGGKNMIIDSLQIISLLTGVYWCTKHSHQNESN